MNAAFLQSIPDGSKIYFRPVGAIAPAFAIDTPVITCGTTGLSYVGGIVYHRISNNHTAAFISSENLLSVLSALPGHVRVPLEQQISGLAQPLLPLHAESGEMLNFSRTRIMGVLNVTPDSFSDGGVCDDTHTAVRRGRQMLAEGADIIDIGGESTRPGATPVWEGDEAARVIPVIEALRTEGAWLSVDTRRASVMEKALQAGAHIINDVSALSHDADSLKVAARAGVPVVLMHAQGDPRTMQNDPTYDHVVLDIYDYLSARIETCTKAGIDRSQIVIDPGIGFGKRVVQDNLALLNGLSLFLTLGCPVLLGASRKRFLGAITGVDVAKDRVVGSVTAALKAMQNGAHILRVHDVAKTVEAMKMAQAFRDSEVMDGRR